MSRFVLLNVILFGSYGLAWAAHAMWPGSGIEIRTLGGIIAFGVLAVAWVVQARSDARGGEPDGPENSER